MEPEAFAEAMRSFIEETNRLNHVRRVNHGAEVERLEKARKAIVGIVAAIEDGGYSRPLMERLRGLEAEVEEIEAKLAEAPRDVPDVHPNVAELYRRKVERLSMALDERDEAAQALRALIDRIVLEPGPQRGEVLATLYGDLETILAWAADQGGQRQEAVMGFPAGALSVAVNTRACVGDPLDRHAQRMSF